MFDVPSVSKSPWAVQLLTFDYLIDGYIDGDREHYNLTLVYLVKGGAVNMHLTSVRFQPTRNSALPTPPPAPWALVYGDGLVAVIPRDEAGTTFVTKKNADLFKVAVPAEVYVGPYVLRGKVLSPDKELTVFESYRRFAMQDAEISCLLPGALLTGLQAPYVLVVADHKQLLTPLA
jgi:hypothetical protein